MQISIVNFRLEGIDHEQYAQGCLEVAQAFAEVPGLLSKVWLADREGGVYGGVYLWADGEALDAFRASELFAAVRDDPTLTDMTMRSFEVLEGPSRTTRGIATATV